MPRFGPRPHEARTLSPFTLIRWNVAVWWLPRLHLSRKLIRPETDHTDDSLSIFFGPDRIWRFQRVHCIMPQPRGFGLSQPFCHSTSHNHCDSDWLVSGLCRSACITNNILFTGLSSRRQGHVGFVVSKVAVVQVFPLALLFFSHHSTSVPSALHQTLIASLNNAQKRISPVEN